MAILSTLNLLSEQRLGIDDMRRIESAARNDFDELVTGIITNTSQPYIVRGFTIPVGGAIGAPANGLTMIVDPGCILNFNASVSGTIFQVPTGTVAQTLNAAVNTNVIGSFTANATNYVGIDYDRFADPSTDITKYIWNPTANDELPVIAPAAQTLTFVIYITTSTWAANVAPVAKVVTDGNGNVVSISDCRWLLCSLETGGLSPNPNYVYPWTEGRTQPPVTTTSDATDPFNGGDKQLTCLKDWMNAIMSSILSIQGTPYWFSGSGGGGGPIPSIISLFQDLGNTVITGSGSISNGILPNSDAILATTATVTSGSNQLTALGSVAGLSNGDFIFGTGIPTGTTILSVGQYQFTVSSANATAGATYTNNGQTFTVASTISGATTLVTTGTGAPTASGVLTKATGTGDTTIIFSSFTTVSTTITMSANATANGTTVTFYSPSVITQPGQINWDQPIFIRVIGSSLTYELAANPSSTDITLADDQVAYITLVRDQKITPNLVFTTGSPVVTSVGNVAWTSGLLAGDYVRLASDTVSGYYEILTVNSSSQVTLTTNVLLADNTGVGGAQALYAFGSYSAAPTPTTNRNIYITSRETVPTGGNVFWLFMREDNGGAERTYIRFLSEELDNGESVEVSGTTSQQLLKYIGSSSAADSFPLYVSSLNPNSIPEIQLFTFPAGSAFTATGPGQYFFISSSGNARQYYVWFNVSSGNTDPAPGYTNSSIEVPITAGMSAAQVVAAVVVAFNGTFYNDFTAVQQSTTNQVQVTNNSAGSATAASNFNIPSGFTVSVTQAGTGTGNTIIQDGDNLTLAIKLLDDAIGNIIFAIDSPDYDEPVDIVASGATPPTSLNSPVVSGTNITLPNNTRMGNIVQKYTVGKGVLEVYLNGVFQRLGDDWTEVGAAGTASTQIEMSKNLLTGDSLEFRINVAGGGAGGGGEQGPAGPVGPTGPPGADAAGGPISISTKTSNYVVLSTDCFLEADCTSGAVTFTLPAVASVTGRIYYFKKIDSTASPMTIQGHGAELIDGSNTQPTTFQYEEFSIISTGSHWDIF